MKKISEIYFCLLFIAVSCTNPEQITIDLTKSLKFSTGDELTWSKPQYDDSSWKTIDPSKNWEEQSYKNYDGYAWYRVTFFLTDHMKQRSYLKDSIQVYLGNIYNADQLFINGILIGQNGKYIPMSKLKEPSDFVHDTLQFNKIRKYIIPVNDKRLLWNEKNVLAIRVYNHSGDGGIIGNDLKIEMRDIKDYLFFNINKNTYSFNTREHLFTNINLTNYSNKESFEGKLTVRIKNIEAGDYIFEKTIITKIEANSNKKIDYDCRINSSQRHSAEYTFMEKNSHLFIYGTEELPYILTPRASEIPKIHSPEIIGVKFGSPVEYTISASGEKPIKYYAKNLPYGFTIDSLTGHLTGKLWEYGEYKINLVAKNTYGEGLQTLRIKVGNTISLTPPMGWSSEKIWRNKVDSLKIIEAAVALKKTGLADYSWSYILIDDGWQALARTKENELTGNEKFGNMKTLIDSIHKLGLKAGIYSTPDDTTFNGNLGSKYNFYYDVWTWNKWGVDLLKYERCLDNEELKTVNINNHKRSFVSMFNALNQVKRNITYGIYGRNLDDVWNWGKETGANYWQIPSFDSCNYTSIVDPGFNMFDKIEQTNPGKWSYPGLIVAGSEYYKEDKPNVNELYSQISLWSILSAPLFISVDLERLDQFALSLLTNHEVLAINQDPAGKPAQRVLVDEKIEVWKKQLENGTVAIGLFNRGKTDTTYTLNFAKINFEGEFIIRDLWRQKNIGTYSNSFTTLIPNQGVLFTSFTRKSEK